MAMKVTRLVFLLLLSNLVAGSSDDAMEKALATSLEKSYVASREAVTLLYNVFLEVTRYECRCHADDCAAWQAVDLIEALELHKINCDEQPKNKHCRRARQFLGSDLTQDEMIKQLLSIGEGVPTQDYSYLNAIRDSIIDYVCYKKQSDCAALKLVP